MAFQWTIGHGQNDVSYKGGRMGKNKTYRENDSYDYRMIGTVARKILDCPIFTAVGFAIRGKERRMNPSTIYTYCGCGGTSIRIGGMGRLLPLRPVAVV
jgi:hypothetical protein